MTFLRGKQYVLWCALVLGLTGCTVAEDADDDGKADEAAEQDAGKPTRPTGQTDDDDDQEQDEDQAEDEGEVDATPPGNKPSLDAGGERPRSDAGPKPGDAGGGSTPRVDAGGGSVPAGDAGKPPATCSAGPDKPAQVVAPSSISQLSGKPAPKGPLPAVIESDPGLATHTVYRPEQLGATPHPLVVWANGGCSKNGTYFANLLRELASHGFVIVADGKPNGTGTGPLTTNGAPQIAAIDWLVAENERPCSKYYKKLDTSKIAAMGQSCGGLMTLGASGDKRISTVVIWNSGLFQRDQKIYDALHAPMAYFIGGSTDVAYPQAQADVAAISKVPLFYGNLDVGHFATYSQPNAGEFGRVAVGWLKWHLLGDQGASGKGMFAGADCELCKPPSKWVVKKKNME